MKKELKSFSVSQSSNPVGIISQGYAGVVLPDMLVTLDSAVRLKRIVGMFSHLVATLGTYHLGAVGHCSIANPNTSSPVFSDNGKILSITGGNSSKNFCDRFSGFYQGAFNLDFGDGIYLPAAFAVFNARIANLTLSLAPADTMYMDLTFFYEEL